jgi:predicted RNase H-like HicB family nuclease
MTLPHGITLPKDIIEQGVGYRGWVNCTFFGETIEEVQAKRKTYFGEYPPEGYDTHTEGSIQKHSDGYYLVRIRRWSTCD